MKYFDAGAWPIYIGFTRSEAEFIKELKRLKVPNEHIGSFCKGGAAMHTLESENGGLTCIITLHEWKGYELAQVAAMVAHEAVHVAQALWEHIGEREPGKEAEAYFIQWLTQCCLLELKEFKKKVA